MLLYIQNPRTGLFYKTAHEWVDSQDQARPFSNALSLYNFCHENGLHDVHIVVKDRRIPRGPDLGRLPFQTIAV